MKERFLHLSERWQACLAAFLARTASENTQRCYCVYLTGLFREKSPGEITIQDVETYINAPSRRGRKQMNNKRRINVPLTFYDFARKYLPPGESLPIIDRNPVKEFLNRPGPFAHLPLRWQACLEAFIMRPASAYTQGDYRTYLRGCFAQKAPDEMTAQDIEQYVHAPSSSTRPVRTGQVGRETRRQRITVPSMFYDFARKYIPEGESAPIIDRNPAKECYPLLWPATPLVKDTPFYDRFPPEWKAATLDFLDSIYDISGSEQSRAGYRDVLRNFFEMFPAKSPADMTRAECQAFVNRLSVGSQGKGKPVSAATKNHRLCVLNSYYKWASTYLVKNEEALYQRALPTLSIRYLKTGANGRALSDDETKRFFAAIDRSTTRGKRNFAIFYFYWISGRRRLEIQRLRWSDLSQTTFVDDAGNMRQGWQYSYVAKGNSRQRRVRELPEGATALILDYLQSSGRLATMRPDSPLFAPVQPGKGRKNGAVNEPLSPQYIYLEFKHYLALAGIDPKKYALHSLRHSAAHVRYTLTRDIRKVSEFLGHSNIGTTDKYIKQLMTPQDDDSRLVESKYAALLEVPHV